jgi:hypothetical protein
LLLFSCPTPTVTPTPTPAETPVSPYVMDILGNQIYNVSYLLEYSLNNKSTWTDCGGGIVNVSFAQGNRVWVREKANPSNEWFLGEVKYTTGYPDLAPSSRIAFSVWDSSLSTPAYVEKKGCVPGDSVRIWYKYNNIGMSDSNRSFSTSLYLSTNKNISTNDTLLGTQTYTRTLAQGLNPTTDNSYYVLDLTMPSVSPGTYYVGYILDSASNITELNDDNNTSPANAVAEVIVSDATSNPGGGAFKFVNSWGASGSWEKIHDGHYWVTYDTLKALQMPIFYYTNNFSVQYKPTVIAVFQLTHPERDKCNVILGLGDPNNPYITKEFQARSGTTILSGAIPFPNNALALDISEFASMINSANLFLKISTSSGAVDGTVNSFAVKYYSVYDGSLLKTVTGGNGSFAGNSGVTTFSATTTGALTPDLYDDITPPARFMEDSVRFVEELPSSDELARDMQIIGVAQPGKSYNNIVDGQFGTGFIPPTYEEWLSFKKLRNIERLVQAGTFANQKIDYSTSQYFPPIGNQGAEGSCVCYSTGYYIHTYTMAKEFGWNLTGTAYGGTYPGAPQSNTDKIMSPDFIYHQINQGADNGSSFGIALSLLTRMGCASWSTMPYSDTDHTTWPSEAAFMEATKYRAGEVNRVNGYLYYGYFLIRTDADINLLKNLLMSGYLVTSAIDADKSDDGVRLYDYLNANDVIDNCTLTPMTTNHAQTIVGFKDGTSWHIGTPED